MWMADGAASAAATAEPPLMDAMAASGWTVGVAAIVALTAIVAPLRRAAYFRCSAASSRRCSERFSERSQSDTSLRSRLYGGSIGNDST